jgi:TPR repeat protein
MQYAYATFLAEDKQDYGAAVQYMAKSANQGFEEAQLLLAKYSFIGAWGLPKNYSNGMGWLQLPYLQGNAKAVELMEKMTGRTKFKYAWTNNSLENSYWAALDYYYGRDGKEKDLSTAVVFMEYAAERGYKEAQARLGKWWTIFDDIKESDKNIKEGLKFLEEAANRNDAEACFTLAEIYRNGKYLPKNTDKTLAYLKASADLGYPFAQLLLGESYGHEKATSDEIQIAVKYLQMASQNDATRDNANKELARYK